MKDKIGIEKRRCALNAQSERERGKEKVIAIDPGPRVSAWLVIESGSEKLIDFGLTENEVLLHWLLTRERGRTRHLIVERIKSYGNVIGDDVLETVFWSGRFTQAYGADNATLITRKEIVTHLCNRSTANDRNVRQALIDRFAKTGGGKNPSIGTKAQPGPLYGVTRDVWSALAGATTFLDTRSFFL